MWKCGVVIADVALCFLGVLCGDIYLILLISKC